MSKNNIRHIIQEEWKAEGIELFGEDVRQWEFVCPACGIVTKVQEWIVEVGYGEFGQKVLRGNCRNCYNDDEYYERG